MVTVVELVMAGAVEVTVAVWLTVTVEVSIVV